MADKTSEVQSYLDSLNEAMAIHAKKAIEGLEFDRTELAEIVDITNRDKGEYQVYNGSQRYFAYSENTSYTLKTKVYVTIPNNDYTQQKLIKGKYKSNDSDTTINWISPLESYTPLTEINLIEDSSVKDINTPYVTEAIKVNDKPLSIEVLQDYDNSTGTCLLANYNSDEMAASTETSDGATYASDYKVLYKTSLLQEDSIYNQNYKYMGISAKFKTGLSGFHPIAGSYGLLFLVEYSIKLSGEDERINKLKVCKLDSPSMIGNVYNFDTFYKQEALFQLDNNPENGLLIKRITVVFYQDGEFRDVDNKLISPYLDEAGTSLLPVKNICVKDIEVYFGNDVIEETDDQAKIFTLNGLMYDSAQTNEKLNEKRIHLEWLHKNPNPQTQEDGTLRYIKEIMTKNNLQDVPSDADVKLIANIHWYTDASYTTDAMRTEIADNANHADKLWEVTEKWKYAPNSLTEDDIDVLVNETNWTSKKDYVYQYDKNALLYDEYGQPIYKKDSEGNIITDQNDNPIQETGGRYVLTVTASGEQVLNRTVTRNSKEDVALSVSDELAGPGWVPIPGSGLNNFEIVYQPDVKRGECSVKCIIEYGPELLVENEETGKFEKTGLVDPNSAYYTVVVAMDSYEQQAEDHLTFKNLSWVPDLATHDVASGLTITTDDGTGGNYPIYNATDNRILSRYELDKIRVFTADMLSKYTGNSLLNGNEVVLWKIPKANTMISIDGTLSEDKKEVVTSENFNAIFNNVNISKIEDKIINLDLGLSEEELNNLKEQILNWAIKYSTINKWYNDALLEYKEATDRYNSSENPEEDIIEYNTATEIYESKKQEYEEALESLRTEVQMKEAYYIFTDRLNKIANKYSDDASAYQQAADDLINNNIVPEDCESDINQGETAFDLFKIIMEVSPNDHDLSKWFKLEDMDFDNYYYIIRFGSDVSSVNPYQQYKVKEYYSVSATNNTVYCYLVKNNQIYDGQITLTFAQHGSSGTDYTFALGLGELVKLPSISYISKKDENDEDVVFVDEDESEYVIYVDSWNNEFIIVETTEIVNDVEITTQTYWKIVNGVKTEQFDPNDIIGKDFIDYSSTPWVNIGPASSALTVGQEGFRKINFNLYDSKNQLIELTNEQKHAIISEWVNRTNAGYYCGKTNAAKLQFLVKSVIHPRDGTAQSGAQYYIDVAVRAPQRDISDYRYIILSASVRQQTAESDGNTIGPVNFTQLLPLHIRGQEKYVLEGADYITYDDKGANPQSYSDKFTLLNAESLIEDEFGNKHPSEMDVKFKILVNGTPLTENNINDYRYYPHLDENNKLVPCAIYVSNLDNNIAVEAYSIDSVNDQEIETLLYTMPLLIIQNRYEIPAINSWNGKLKIDEAGNTVMAATIAAGHKNQDNSFTGVIMGDVERVSEESGSKKVTTGLYGYNKGAESFGLTSDGTAFIGKSGTGRIEFDGTHGYIRSANYVVENKEDSIDPIKIREGTLVDLDQGYIDMWGQGNVWKPEGNRWVVDTNSSSNDKIPTNIHLDTRGNQNSPYFKIAVPRYTTIFSNNDYVSSLPQDGNYELQSLIQVDKNNFYLQTADYQPRVIDSNNTLVSPGSGLKIDLKNGRLDSWGPLYIKGALGSTLEFGSSLSHILFGIDNRGKSSFEMTYSNISEDSYSANSTTLVSLAKDLNSYLYNTNLSQNNDTWIFNGGNGNNPDSPFNNPTLFNIPNSYSVRVIFPKDDRTYVSILQGKLAELRSTIGDSIGTINDIDKSYIDYLNEGTAFTKYIISRNRTVIKENDEDTNISLQDLISNNILYKEEIENFTTIDNSIEEEPVEVVVSSWSHYIKVDNVENFINDFFNNQNNAEINEVYLYTKGYNTWKEPIEPWQPNIIYGINDKVYTQENNVLSIYSSLINNNQNNSVLDTNKWNTSEQEKLLSNAEEDVFDQYIEVANKGNTDGYRQAKHYFDQIESDYNVQKQNLENANNALEVANANLTAAKNARENEAMGLESGFKTYNYLIKPIGNFNNVEKPFPDQIYGGIWDAEHLYLKLSVEEQAYFPSYISEKNADSQKEFVFPYYEEYKKIYNKQETKYRRTVGDFTYQELLKLQQEASAKKAIINHMRTRAENAYWDKNNYSYAKDNSTTGFAKKYGIRNSSKDVNKERFLQLYNAYVENLASEEKGLQDLIIIKNFFLKDIGNLDDLKGLSDLDNLIEADLTEDYTRDFGDVFLYNNTKEHFNNYDVVTDGQSWEGEEKPNYFFDYFINGTNNTQYKNVIIAGMGNKDNSNSILGTLSSYDRNIASLLTEQDTFSKYNESSKYPNTDVYGLTYARNQFTTVWVPYDADFINNSRVQTLYNGYALIWQYIDTYLENCVNTFNNWQADPDDIVKKDEYATAKGNLALFVSSNGDLYRYYAISLNLNNNLGEDFTPENESINISLMRQHRINLLSATQLNSNVDQAQTLLQNKVSWYEELVVSNNYYDHFNDLIDTIEDEKTSYIENSDIIVQYSYANYTISVLRNILITDYDLLIEEDSIKESIKNLKNEEITINNKNIRIRNFEEDGTFKLYTKYNNYLNKDKEYNEIDQHIKDIQTIVDAAKALKENYEKENVIFIKIGNQNDFNAAIRNNIQTYNLVSQAKIAPFVKKNSDYGLSDARNIDAYNKIIESITWSNNGKNYRLKRASDLTELTQAINTAQNAVTAAENAQNIANAAFIKEENRLKAAQERLNRFDNNYVPLILTQELINNNKENYYYLTEDENFAIINLEDLATYENQLVYKLLPLSSLELAIFEIIDKKIKNNSNNSLYDKYSTKILQYIEAYSTFKELQNNNDDYTVKINNTQSTRLQIGTKFKVNNKGEITASGGTIGGWKISNNSLSGGSLTLNNDGSLRGSNWYINADGTASFKNGFSVGYGGNGAAGFGWDGGNAYFWGDIHANNGYFSGTINAAKISGGSINGSSISGGTISGSTITGGTITGTTISANGYVTCAGLRVKGTEYAMTNKTVVSYIDRESAGFGVMGNATRVTGVTGYCNLTTGAVTIYDFWVPLPISQLSATHINSLRTASLTYLGKYVDI